MRSRVTARTVFITGLIFAAAAVSEPFLFLEYSKIVQTSSVSGAEALVWWDGTPLAFAGIALILISAVPREAIFRRLVVGLWWGTVPMLIINIATIAALWWPLLHGARITMATEWDLRVNPVVELAVPPLRSCFLLIPFCKLI